MIASGLLWVLFGFLYCIYRIAKDSHHGSAAYGVLWVGGIILAAAFLLLFIEDYGWLLWPLIFIAIPTVMKIIAVYRVRSTDDYEEKINAYLDSKIVYENPTETQIRTEEYYDKMIENMRIVRKAHLEDIEFTDKAFEVFIPIAWAFAPVSYIMYGASTRQPFEIFILAFVPFTIATFYIKMFFQK